MKESYASDWKRRRRRKKEEKEKKGKGERRRTRGNKTMSISLADYWSRSHPGVKGYLGHFL